MSKKPATENPLFIVQFPDTDQLSIGPFPSHEAAEAFGTASVFHAIGARFEVVGVIAPRPDHVATPNPVDRARLRAALVAAKDGANEIQLAHATGFAVRAVRDELMAMKGRREAFYHYSAKGRIWHAEARPVATGGVGVQSATSTGGDGVQSGLLATPLYRQEFPDFDYDLPVIPGMVDRSWHNDVSPSLIGNGFQLWCDYADPAKRETDGGNRFTLYRDFDDNIGALILASDSLDDIMAAMAQAAATA